MIIPNPQSPVIEERPGAEIVLTPLAAEQRERLKRLASDANLQRADNIGMGFRFVGLTITAVPLLIDGYLVLMEPNLAEKVIDALSFPVAAITIAAAAAPYVLMNMVANKIERHAERRQACALEILAGRPSPDAPQPFWRDVIQLAWQRRSKKSQPA